MSNSIVGQIINDLRKIDDGEERQQFLYGEVVSLLMNDLGIEGRNRFGLNLNDVQDFLHFCALQERKEDMAYNDFPVDETLDIQLEYIRAQIQQKSDVHETLPLQIEEERDRATNYFVQNADTKVLVIETQGGAGHIQAAEQRMRDLKSGYNVGTGTNDKTPMEEHSIEKISVLQNPDSNKDSWMKLGPKDVGKDVIRDWNAKQKAGNMGNKTNVHAFRAQVKAGEAIFGHGAGKSAFITICARPNLVNIYDTQNMFTRPIASSVNEYLDIKRDEEKCRKHNEKVDKYCARREKSALGALASERFMHKIEYDPSAGLTYTKVLTDLPTAAEDFYPSLRLMKKEDFVNFRLEAPHAAPLTNTKYDKENVQAFYNLIMGHDEFSALRGIFKKEPDNESENPKLESFNEEYSKHIASGKAPHELQHLYDRAYYIMKCPNLIHLAKDNFQFTIGPVKQEFREIHSARVSGQFSVEQKKAERVIIKSSKVEGSDQEKRESLRKNAFLEQNMAALSGELTDTGTSGFNIDKDDKIISLMLGSQASVKTLEYIKSIVDVAGMNPNEQQKLFVFTGNYKNLGEDEQCLYERVCKLIVELKQQEKLPDNLKIIPVENQDAKMISHVYSVADEVIIRTGGLSSMEVEAVCKPECRILLHSEETCDKQDIQRGRKEAGINDKEVEEAFEERLAGTMMPWEEGNAKHIQAQRGSENVKYVNPESYKYQCSSELSFSQQDSLTACKRKILLEINKIISSPVREEDLGIGKIKSKGATRRCLHGLFKQDPFEARARHFLEFIYAAKDEQSIIREIVKMSNQTLGKEALATKLLSISSLSLGIPLEEVESYVEEAKRELEPGLVNQME